MPPNVNSFPWTGTSPGSAGPYSAAQFAAFMSGLYSRGADAAETSVLYGSGTGIVQYPTAVAPIGFDVAAQSVPNMSVNVGGGTAVVNGTWVQNPGVGIVVPIASNVSGNPRIDTIVIHLDITAQTANVIVLQGTPGGAPTPPALTQTALIWEVPLADIAVANAAASITNANITPRTVYASAPDGIYIAVKNNSGATLQTGDVVVWDNTATQAVKTSSTANDPTVAGVIVGRTPATKIGVMLVKGVGFVTVNGAVSAGQILTHSSTAKQAAPGNLNTSSAAFGYAMGAVGGAGLTMAYIDASQVQQSNENFLITQRPIGYLVRQGVADYTTVSAVFVDVDAANLILNINPGNGTRVLVEAVFVATAPVGIDMFFDIILDSTTRAGGTAGIGRSLSINTAMTYKLLAVFQNLTPNVNHTFKLQYRIASGASPGTINNNGTAITMFGIPI